MRWDSSRTRRKRISRIAARELPGRVTARVSGTHARRGSERIATRGERRRAVRCCRRRRRCVRDPRGGRRRENGPRPRAPDRRKHKAAPRRKRAPTAAPERETRQSTICTRLPLLAFFSLLSFSLSLRLSLSYAATRRELTGANATNYRKIDGIGRIVCFPAPCAPSPCD